MNKAAGGAEILMEFPKSVTFRPDSNTLRNNRVVMGSCKDPRADIFRVLRTNILKQLRDNHWKSFAITSATPGAGKTFVSLNLAIALAMEGNQKVLLVDGDLRHPSVNRYLGLETRFGIGDCLEKGVPPGDVVINTGIENFMVLPGKNPIDNPSELISSPRMADLIKGIRSQHESGLLIFDLPPLFLADDTLLMMSSVDAALLVVEDGKNTTEELQHAMLLLEQTNLLGLVLNKATQPLRSYQYGYFPAAYEK